MGAPPSLCPTQGSCAWEQQHIILSYPPPHICALSEFWPKDLVLVQLHQLRQAAPALPRVERSQRVRSDQAQLNKSPGSPPGVCLLWGVLFKSPLSLVSLTYQEMFLAHWSEKCLSGLLRGLCLCPHGGGARNWPEVPSQRHTPVLGFPQELEGFVVSM